MAATVLDRQTVPQVSDVERDVLHWLSLGKKAEDIAQIMNMSTPQVWQRSHRIMRKLQTETTAGAVAIALRQGIIT